MAFSALLSAVLGATTLQVGPTRTYTNLPAALAAAADGDTIEIDYNAGTPYVFPGTNVSQNNLTIRGVGGRAVLTAANTDGSECAAIGGGHRTVNNIKGIIAINAGVQNTTIENLEIYNATVCGDHTSNDGGNGAAVRGQGNGLIIRGCYFHDNQNGILACPATGTGEILVENTELAYNGNDGYEHNIYANGNTISKLTFRYNYSHHALGGHLLKTRAMQSFIYGNRLSDESTGQSSAVIDVPDGGLAVIVGNLMNKGPQTTNASAAVWLAQESENNAPSAFYVVNNTYVNNDGNASTVMVHANRGDQFYIANNIVLGDGNTIFKLDEADTYASRAVTLANNLIDNSTGTLGVYNSGGSSATDVTATVSGNIQTANAMLVDETTYDYHLLSGSPAVDAATDPGTAQGFTLQPTYQYVHPAAAETRPEVGALDIGAYELGGTPTPLTGDPPALGGPSGGDPGPSGGDSGPSGGDSGPSGGDTSGPQGADTASPGGDSGSLGGASVTSGCTTLGAPGVAGLGLLLGIAGARRLRRR